MTLWDLKIGDVIQAIDPRYMKIVMKYGGPYGYKKGTVKGFSNDVGHIMKPKIHLEAEDGNWFSIYDYELDYWEKV